MPVIDLAPMVALIERQAREVAEYREAAAMWQERARSLEGQLKALAPGEITPSTSSEAPGSPRSDEAWVSGLLLTASCTTRIKWSNATHDNGPEHKARAVVVRRCSFLSWPDALQEAIPRLRVDVGTTFIHGVSKHPWDDQRCATFLMVSSG